MAWLTGLAALLARPTTVAAEPLFDYLGQFGDVHTPFTEHDIREVNRRGEFIGVSSGRGSTTRVSAWIARPNGTQLRLGFFGPAFVSPSGQFFSFPGNLTESGYVIGGSSRQQPAGAIAWLARTDGVTARIGYYDELHTDPEGQQVSRAEDINEWGLVVGTSARHLGGADAGQTAWVALGSGYIRPIGFYDAKHTRGGGSQGYKSSFSNSVNERGISIGYSTSFINPANPGLTAWFANARGETYRLGYYDAQHTAPDGHQWSVPVALNQAGDVLGVSHRFVGFGGRDELGEIIGRSCWLASTGGRIRRLGLFDAVHTAPDGFHQHSPWSPLTESGYSSGTSGRFDRGLTAAEGSHSAWIANRAGATRQVGLYDADHTRADGLIRNTPTRLHEYGWLGGQAERFAGSESRGASAWVVRYGGAARRVGLYDAAHTSSSGHQYSYVRFIGTNGAVVGASWKYRANGLVESESHWITHLDGGATIVFAELPRDAIFATSQAGYVWTPDWVYNTTSRQMIRPNGRVFGVTPKGVNYGRGTHDRAFAWIPGRGQVEIAAHVDTALGEDGWESWFDVLTFSTTGHLIGRGWLANTNREHHLVYLVRLAAEED